MKGGGVGPAGGVVVASVPFEQASRPFALDPTTAATEAAPTDYPSLAGDLFTVGVDPANSGVGN